MIAYSRWQSQRGTRHFLLIVGGKNQELSHGFANEHHEEVAGRLVSVKSTWLSSIRMTVPRGRKLFYKSTRPCLLGSQFSARGVPFCIDCKIFVSCLDDEERSNIYGNSDHYQSGSLGYEFPVAGHRYLCRLDISTYSSNFA